MKTSMLSLRLTPALHEALRLKAEQEGRRMSDIVISLILKYVGKLPEALPETWPSGWPRAIKCPRCPKIHDPREHASVDDYMLAQVKALTGSEA